MKKFFLAMALVFSVSTATAEVSCKGGWGNVNFSKDSQQTIQKCIELHPEYLYQVEHHFTLRNLMRGSTVETVKSLINAGGDVQTFYGRPGNNGTLLHYAAQGNDPEVVRFLITLGADIEARDGHGRTPFYYVSSVPVARLLQNEGADIVGSSSENDQNGILFRLTQIASNKAETLALVKFLLEIGLDPNVVDGEGKTPLSRAYSNDVAQLLLDHGASITHRDNLGGTVLHWNAQKAMIDAGANIEARNLEGRTPLMSAATSTNLPGVELLLQQGADANAADEVGNTSLGLVIWEIADGSDIISSTENRLNPNRTNIIRALCNAGANPNIPNELGLTPLHYAAYGEWPDMISALLDGGSNGSLRDNEGRTPFELVGKHNFIKNSDLYWRLNDSQFE